MRFTKSFGAAVLATVLLTGCVSEFGFELYQKDLSDNDTSVALRTLKPALAVRATGCLMCHAQVKSAMITDFGHGDPYFMDEGTGDAIANGSYYMNHAFVSWQSASLEGGIIIPATNLDRFDHPHLLAAVDPASTRNSMTLAEFITSPIPAGLNGQLFAQPLAPMADPSAPVTEKSEIRIGAPTEEQILALRPDLIGVGAAVASRAEANSALSGLTVQGGGAYVTNADGSFVCHGDVVVRGTLFLVDPRIDAGGGSCRIHASGSIFLQGAIEFTGVPAGGVDRSNLQLSSAKAVLLGFDPATLYNRLALPGSAIAAWTLPYAFTREGGTPLARRQAIYAEAQNLPGMQDAQSLATQPTYSRLLLNAPEVHSRYTTHFHGAIIGEIVLFRLGQFYFEFDPVFESVGALPLLGDSILRVRD